MKRRDFIKSGLVSIASKSVVGPSAFGLTVPKGETRSYVEGKRVTLRNGFLDWELLMAGGGVKSIGLRNKLSGHHFELGNSKEFSLTFSSAKARIEIPWWFDWVGPDHDKSSPNHEQGYLRGFQSEDFRGEAKWNRTLNLLFRIGMGVDSPPPVFDGYAWFRQWFNLPKDGESERIVFCLGGYDNQDWNEYWLYLNGTQIAHWKKSGRWRTPEIISLHPGSSEYKALRFGSGQKNLLAIRTYQTDKRIGGVPGKILDRYYFEGRLYDQLVAVGEPYLHLDDSSFELSNWREEGSRERPHYVFELTNSREQLQVTAHYELDEYIRRKWLEVRNVGDQERLLLDVDVDDFSVATPMTEGDFGFPVIAGDEMFIAVEHPAGLSQGMEGRVRLQHFPGKKLAPGATLSTKVSIVGVSAQNKGRQQFVDYIQSHSPRKKMLAIYDPLGINGFPDSPCWTLCDNQMLDTLKLLGKWQKRGVKFDYYVPDVGWQDWTGDLTRFWPQCFPEGPMKVIKRVNELAMKWGLWFAATWADWSCGLNPEVTPSRTIVPGGWPDYLYRDNFDINDGRRQLCLASEPYFTMLRDALLYHIRNYNLRFFKLDTGSYYCNNSRHNHLPGKYSTEANYDRVIDIAHASRRANPDIYIMWYWGIRSPFFALYGDSIFESRLKMEGASTGDYPALFFRDAVTLAMDQGVQFADLIPPMNKDSLGIWITDTYWGNSMEKQRWREAEVMDLGRGNLLFPQIWGDLYMFSDDDVNFLSRIQGIAKENEKIFYKRKNIFGNPWNNDIYGYAYFDGVHGFIFMNNVDFQSRRVQLKLDDTIGLKSPGGVRVRLFSHFPEQGSLHQSGQAVFQTGQTIETWLRPFEVAMWEVVPETQAAKGSGLQPRKLPSGKADVDSQRLVLETEVLPAEVPHMPGYSGMDIYYGPPEPNFRTAMARPTLEEFRKMGYEKRIMARMAKLPQMGPGHHVLAIVLRFRKDGKPWRYRQPADLVQAKATIGGQPILRFMTVPNFRQTNNNEWCPWLVFKIRMNPAWSGKDLFAAINAYLPPEVEVDTEAWVVPQWWI